VEICLRCKHTCVTKLLNIAFLNRLFRMNYDRFENLPPLPVNVHVTKGSVHIIASRAFVDFVIYNDTALKFRDWIKTSYYPDETFFSSLNHSPKLGVPGAYLGLYICGIFKMYILHFLCYKRLCTSTCRLITQ